jgi:hypothetical protein
MLSCVEQPKRCDPRLVQIHAGVLIGSDADTPPDNVATLAGAWIETVQG